MIEQLSPALRSFTSSVKTLGAITVAFFLLLGFLIYLQASTLQSLQTGQVQQSVQLDRMERKVDGIAADAKQGADTQRYFLRQICVNVAKSEADKIACNPPSYQ